MRDNYGVFYYPQPENKRLKMYVRISDGVVEFRPAHADNARLWEQHGWIPYEAAKKADEYSREQGKRYPLHLYDFDVALGVLSDVQPEAVATVQTKEG